MRYNERTGEFEETFLERTGFGIGWLWVLVCLPFRLMVQIVVWLWMLVCLPFRLMVQFVGWACDNLCDVALGIWKIFCWICKMILCLWLILVGVSIVGCIFGG